MLKEFLETHSVLAKSQKWEATHPGADAEYYLKASLTLLSRELPDHMVNEAAKLVEEHIADRSIEIILHTDPEKDDISFNSIRNREGRMIRGKLFLPTQLPAIARKTPTRGLDTIAHVCASISADWNSDPGNLIDPEDLYQIGERYASATITALLGLANDEGIKLPKLTKSKFSLALRYPKGVLSTEPIIPVRSKSLRKLN